MCCRPKLCSCIQWLRSHASAVCVCCVQISQKTLICCVCLLCADNPEDIDLGDDDEGGDEGEDDGDGGVQQKPVPAAVFGSLADKAAAAAAEGDGEDQGQEQQPLGALERFKRRKVE